MSATSSKKSDKLPLGRQLPSNTAPKPSKRAIKGAGKAKPAKRIDPPPRREGYFTYSVAKTFKERREDLEIELGDIAAETKIQARFLKALEDGRYNELPHTIHTVGFVKRYATHLGLDANTAANKYLLERGPLPIPRGRPTKQRVAKPIVGTKVIISAVLGLLLLGLIGYLIWLVAVLTRPPALHIDTPPNNHQTIDNNVEVKGNATAGAEIFVNGNPILSGDNGSFSTNLNLQNGLNTITVEARNKRGKVTRVERTILVQSR
jgi:cytoskeletal protein RodZ